MWAVEVAGQRLFSASADKTIRVWDIESRRCEQVRAAERLALHTRCSVGAGGYTTAGCNQLVDLAAQVLEDHTRPVLSLAVTDRKLFSGSYDYTIKVWSLDTLQRLKTLTGARRTLLHMARSSVQRTATDLAFLWLGSGAGSTRVGAEPVTAACCRGACLRGT